jgi:16S rRNA (uracil1498-N3)-methyltransferase
MAPPRIAMTAPLRTPRLYSDQPLALGQLVALGAAATRHAQVLRLQPGDALALFDGRGGEWLARVATMGRREVSVEPVEHLDIEREARLAVTVALVMPAGERMDFVVEKAVELGACAIQPLHGERSVLRLSGERTARRVAHWQALAIAACEQCGRNRVPAVRPVSELLPWLASLGPAAEGQARWLLHPQGAPADAATARGPSHAVVLSGPEGGLAPAEIDAAQGAGFEPLSLGPRVLRADTAPIAALDRLVGA